MASCVAAPRKNRDSVALGDTRGLVDPVDVDPGQGTTAEPTQTFWAAFVGASGGSGAEPQTGLGYAGICWAMAHRSHLCHFWFVKVSLPSCTPRDVGHFDDV